MSLRYLRPPCRSNTPASLVEFETEYAILFQNGKIKTENNTLIHRAQTHQIDVMQCFQNVTKRQRISR